MRNSGLLNPQRVLGEDFQSILGKMCCVEIQLKMMKAKIYDCLPLNRYAFAILFVNELVCMCV